MRLSPSVNRNSKFGSEAQDRSSQMSPVRTKNVNTMGLAGDKILKFFSCVARKSLSSDDVISNMPLENV